MIASLAMYDLPGYEAGLDRLWAAIRDELRAEGIAAPDDRNRSTDLWSLWTSPDLVLAQTCSLPLRTGLRDKVTFLGAFDFGLPNAPAGHYYSYLVVRVDASEKVADFAQQRLAINGFDSQSGWGAAQEIATSAGFVFSNVRVSGAHFESLRSIKSNTADVAAIDANTWRFLKKTQPGCMDGLKVIAQSKPTPGLPLIAASGADTAGYKAALSRALDKLDPVDRETLSIEGYVDLPLSAYLSVASPPSRNDVTASELVA